MELIELLDALCAVAGLGMILVGCFSLKAHLRLLLHKS